MVKETKHVKKKDILEIKRLTKDKNCHYTKMRGCYISEGGEVRATINETFLNLDESLYYKYLDREADIPAEINRRQEHRA